MFKAHTILAIVLVMVLDCLFAASTVNAEKIKVLVIASYAEELQSLTGQYPDLELVSCTSAQQLLNEVEDASAVVGLPSSYPTAKIVTTGKKLRWIQTMSAGVEVTLRDEVVRNADFTLTNAKIIQGPEIADHAMALLLCHTRDLKFHNEQMTKVGFNRANRLPQIELRGKTVVIVGLGGIGRLVAERCFAFGMRVLAVDPKDMPLSRAIEEVRKPDELDLLLPEADVVISCTPHTPKSEGMIGHSQFAVMKNGVYFINISRGKVVDTEALTAALVSGKIRAAGLDVTDPEPLPSDHPLWSMSNVIITPHNATNSDRLTERRMRLFRENIGRFLAGLPLYNVVQKGRRF